MTELARKFEQQPHPEDKQVSGRRGGDDAWITATDELLELGAALPKEKSAEVALGLMRLTRLFNASEMKAAALARENEALRQEVMTDPLTGIPNRRFFDSELEIAVNGAIDARKAANDNAPKRALCMIDLGGLSAVNDELGQDGGDVAIKAGAALLQQIARDGEHPAHVSEEDRAARIGGDEYALILIDSTGRDNFAEAAGARIKQALKDATFEYEGATYPLSFYVSVVGIDGTQNAQAVFKAAGQSLYDVKAATKEQSREATPALDATPVSKIA